MEPNFESILSVILATEVHATLAREQAANLIEEWIRKFHEEDSKLQIRHVEMGFSIELDSDTIIIGVQDMIGEDSQGILGHEWKTSTESKNWTEDRWLEEIQRGPQLSVYALAQREGTFYEKGKGSFRMGVSRPRIRVRAAVKSNPVKFWPKIPNAGLSSFSTEKLDTVRSALLAKAESIRALRKTAYLPWQLPGKQCFAFGKLCGFFGKHCDLGKPPEDLAVTIFDPSDPATELALKQIDPSKFENPNLVILSASSYDLASQCMEKHRIISGSLGEKSSDLALDIGSTFHAGIAEYYRQLRDRKNTIQ